MGAQIGALVVRRSIWIDAKPDEVWEEFESLERMRAWYGTGHTLVRYEPFVGGIVETNVGTDTDNHDRADAVGAPLRRQGRRIRTGPRVHVRTGLARPRLGRAAACDHPADRSRRRHPRRTVPPRLRSAGSTPLRRRTTKGFEGGWTNRQLVAFRERVTC